MTGIDLAEGMITIAREKASNLGLKVELAHGDMRTFNLGQQFDAVLCTYDSINYMQDEENFATACIRILDHLRPSGLFIFVSVKKKDKNHVLYFFHGFTF